MDANILLVDLTRFIMRSSRFIIKLSIFILNPNGFGVDIYKFRGESIIFELIPVDFKSLFSTNQCI